MKPSPNGMCTVLRGDLVGECVDDAKKLISPENQKFLFPKNPNYLTVLSVKLSCRTTRNICVRVFVVVRISVFVSGIELVDFFFFLFHLGFSSRVVSSTEMVSRWFDAEDEDFPI